MLAYNCTACLSYVMFTPRTYPVCLLLLLFSLQCDTFGGMGGKCTEIDMFPNATVAEYGSIDDGDIHKIMAEIYARGPVAAVINAEPIVAYSGGVFKDKSASKETNHIVSIVGWDRTSKKNAHWIIRNSWGQYWGEMGYVRVSLRREFCRVYVQ